VPAEPTGESTGERHQIMPETNSATIAKYLQSSIGKNRR
jgi:hypothetical protein